MAVPWTYAATAGWRRERQSRRALGGVSHLGDAYYAAIVSGLSSRFH